MLCQPNVPERATVLMTSLSGRFVAKLTFAFENNEIRLFFSPPGSDSLRSELKFYCRCFIYLFFFNARSPRCVGRPAWNFARCSVLHCVSKNIPDIFDCNL